MQSISHLPCRLLCGNRATFDNSSLRCRVHRYYLWQVYRTGVHSRPYTDLMQLGISPTNTTYADHSSSEDALSR